MISYLLAMAYAEAFDVLRGSAATRCIPSACKLIYGVPYDEAVYCGVLPIQLWCFWRPVRVSMGE